MLWKLGYLGVHLFFHSDEKGKKDSKLVRWVQHIVALGPKQEHKLENELARLKRRRWFVISYGNWSVIVCGGCGWSVGRLGEAEGKGGASEIKQGIRV